MLFYKVVKPVVQLSLRVFFRQIEIRHPERLRAAGPVLFCANHPNTLMDPLLIAAHRRQSVAFLAKSTFFKNPVARAIFLSANCIPIFRRQDAQVGGRAATPAEVAAQNEKSFGKSYDHLGRGGALLIFPEGSSISERKLRPLKTGAARIALGTEARHNFQLGLRVQCVGLNYFDPTRFRSDVLLNVAPPIRVAAYAAAYAHDPEAAADQLTAEIELRLARRLVISRDAAEDALVAQVERTFGDHLNPDDDPTTLYDNFQLSRTLFSAVAWFELHDPGRLADLRQRLPAYLAELNKYGLDDAALDDERRGSLTGLLNLVFGFPVWVFGLITNYLPYMLPSMIARRATQDLEFVAPIMLVTGIFTFSLGYALELFIIQHFITHDWRLTTLIGLLMPVAGFYALNYWQALAARRRRLRAARLFRRAPAVGQALLQARAAVLQGLAEARAAYVARAAA
ncbi:lysophospholipid acyltransferase family protein [uncultured Hymenobacter sp.]|uniref:lysophospholipid acyltransferase family protein n=1 Tax=uncultured Hymenobacter sp. TaxID=170016 RepID=UPI0035CADAF3